MPKKGNIPWNKLPPEEARRRNAERCRANYAKNKEAYSARRNAWDAAHSEYLKEKKREYYQKNKERLLPIMKENHKKNWNSLLVAKNVWKRKRKQTDPTFRLVVNMRERIRHAVKTAKAFKSSGAKELLGCSVQFLIGYIESKFEIGMTWENYGKWHIDHIIPCSGFDLSTKEGQSECFHYSNLQPLWAEQNLAKGSIMPDGTRAKTKVKEEA